MALVTTQQLQDYYDHYRDSEITFTKDITRLLNVDPRQIYVKCNGNQWPCIINSASLMAARIIVGVKGGAYAMLSKKGQTGPVSIRFCFINSDKQPVSFLVNGRVHEINPYMNSSELAVITINYTQRPSDELIERLGTLLDANANAIRRKEERIILNPDVKRKLGLTKEEGVVQIQSVPRHCILRDLSFSGAKIIMMGIPKFIMNQPTMLQLRFEEPNEVITLVGSIVAATEVEGRKDILIASIKFDEQNVPYSYKIRINSYLVNLRKHILSGPQETTEQKLAAAKAAQEKAVAAEKARMEAEEKAKAEAQAEGQAPAQEGAEDSAQGAPEAAPQESSEVPPKAEDAGTPEPGQAEESQGA